MAIVAGVDEAGFGPVLGPLVVSGTAFRVPEASVDQCLWDALRETCSDRPAHAARKLVITDSKKLHKSRCDLGPLERAALVMLAVSGSKPATLDELLEHVAPETRAALHHYPWYAARSLAIPTSREIGDVATRANAIRRNAREQGVEFMAAFSEPLLEGQYNRMVNAARNKAVVLMGQALKVIDRILRAAPDENVTIFVDRLGGRMHYREALATSFPEYEFFILEESTERSAYRLNGRSRHVRIEFRTDGEARHLATALASIYSKYLRELFMHLFNEYWCAQHEGLKPTAGYYSDAQRWLGDAAPTIERLHINRDLLVRAR
jgi:ribonuclease HII